MNWLLNPDAKFRPGEDWVHYSKAIYGQEEIDSVVKALKEDWLGNGKYTEEFETKVAEIFGKKFGLFVNSGSSANLLALEVLDFPKGSEVITPACTFGTTAAPIIMKGLIPVFVDSEIPSYNIDLNKVEAAITEKTVAIMTPHIIGSVNDMKRLKEIADKHNLKVIEDSCDTIGSKFGGKPTGAWSDVTTTSFYASHAITAGGGGGMVMVNDPALKQKAKIMRDWGRALPEYFDGKLEERYTMLDGVPYDGKFQFVYLGYNMKPVEMMAAFGLEQLKRLPEFNKKRRKNYEKMRQIFGKYDKYFILPSELPEAEVYWLALPVTIKEDSGLDRQNLVKYLESRKIQTRPLFAGNILRHPPYKDRPDLYKAEGPFKNADRVMSQTFLVGAHHGLTDEMIKYVEDTLAEFFKTF